MQRLLFPSPRRSCSFRLRIVISLLLIASTAIASDWPQFRGPNGNGISSDGAATPVKWSANQSLKWKIVLPGPGSSSPIVVGNKIFVTCWSGYGVDRRAVGEQKNLQRHLICIDRQIGKSVWDKSVPAVLPEDPYNGMFTEHGYATHTPVSDGQRVYVFFGKSGALAFDLDGKQLWQTRLGTGSGDMGWGTSSSPILWKNLVIVPAFAESESLVGLDRETGTKVWTADGSGFAGTWGTPILVPVDSNRTDIVVGVPNEIWGFNPETGKLRWFCEAVRTRSFCSSVATDGKLIFALGDRESGSVAVKVGGDKEITATHTAWTSQDKSRIGSPLIVDGRLYLVNDKVLTCLDPQTGKRIFRGRLSNAGEPIRDEEESRPRFGAGGPGGRGPGGFGGGRGGGGGQDYSSPVAADGKLYYVMRNGDTHVAKLGDQFELLATNHLGDDGEVFNASPAISNGEIFLRSSSHLYCVSPSNLTAERP